MPNYTFRVHKYVFVDGDSHNQDTNNQYVMETVAADTVEDAMQAVQDKHSDASEIRIQLKKVH